MLTARIAILACLALAPVAAQGTGSKPADPAPGQNTEGAKPGQDDELSEEQREALKKRRAAIRERIQRERARRRETNVVRTHVKVRVKLRNGERLQGIVKNGNFVERPSGGLEFVRAEMTQKDAGLRLWYYNRTDGYIFLPYKMIETYKVLKRLTDVEIKIIRDEIVESEVAKKAAATKRRKQLEDKAKAYKEGLKTNEKLDELAKGIEAKKKQAEAEAALLALIEEFPPDEGWGEERINQINIRRLTIKVFPNAKERRFIEVFEQWKQGRDLWIAKKAKDAEAKRDGKQADGSKPEGKSGSTKSSTDSAKPKPGK